MHKKQTPANIRRLETAAADFRARISVRTRSYRLILPDYCAFPFRSFTDLWNFVHSLKPPPP